MAELLFSIYKVWGSVSSRLHPVRMHQDLVLTWCLCITPLKDSFLLFRGKSLASKTNPEASFPEYPVGFKEGWHFIPLLAIRKWISFRDDAVPSQARLGPHQSAARTPLVGSRAKREGWWQACCGWLCRGLCPVRCLPIPDEISAGIQARKACAGQYSSTGWNPVVSWKDNTPPPLTTESSLDEAPARWASHRQPQPGGGWSRLLQGTQLAFRRTTEMPRLWKFVKCL